jgi:amidase
VAELREGTQRAWIGPVCELSLHQFLKTYHGCPGKVRLITQSRISWYDMRTRIKRRRAGTPTGDRQPDPSKAIVMLHQQKFPRMPDLTALRAALSSGRLTSEQLTLHYLERIAEADQDIHAVLAPDPTALRQAAHADRRFAAGMDLGPLDGIPILVKDNIDTAHLSGTAGSRLLTGRPPSTDAPVVTRLRNAGMVILGKTNMSEWSNFRSAGAIEGWSGVGGQTRNPFRTTHSPGGSSAGSAAAVCAGMAPLALGTETDGSVVGPAGLCGVVGVKVERGRLPIEGIVPISSDQDTVGLLAGSVSDASLALAELCGVRIPTHAVRDLRVGLWQVPAMADDLGGLLAETVDGLRRGGIEVVPIKIPDDARMIEDGLLAMYAEFRPSLEEYLRGREGVPRTLAELHAGNLADPLELRYFGQDLFERALEISDAERAAARSARLRSRSAAARTIGRTLAEYGVDAIVAATNEPATSIDYALGERGSAGSSTLPALAGFPNISIPATFSDGLPIGLSVFGPATIDELFPIARTIERWVPSG